MSLINDALKRAKQAQQEKPPANPELQFRPVEPGQEAAPHSPVLVVGAVLGLLVLLAVGGLLIGAVTQQRDAELQVEAKSVSPVVTAATPVDPPPAPLTPPEQAMTNTPVVEPKPPEFKLQGIFFNPRRPSAVVNGKSVFVGDKVSGFRVLAITPATVSVADSTTTNLLSLSE